MPSNPSNTTHLTLPSTCKRDDVKPSPCTAISTCSLGSVPNEIEGSSIVDGLLSDLIKIATLNNILFNPNITNKNLLCTSLALDISNVGVNCTQNDFQNLAESSEHGFAIACAIGDEICQNFYPTLIPCVCQQDQQGNSAENSASNSSKNTWKLAAIHTTTSGSAQLDLIEANNNLFVYSVSSMAKFYGIRNLNKTVLLDKNQSDFSISSSGFVLPTHRSDVMFLAAYPTIYAINTTKACANYDSPSSAPVIFTISVDHAGCIAQKWDNLFTEHFIIFSCSPFCYGFDTRTSENFSIASNQNPAYQYFRISNCASVMQYDTVSGNRFFARSIPIGDIFLLNASSLLGAGIDLNSGLVAQYKIHNNDDGSGAPNFGQPIFVGSINSTLIFRADGSGSMCALCVTIGLPNNSTALCGLYNFDIAGQYISSVQLIFSLDTIKKCLGILKPCITWFTTDNADAHFIDGKLSASSNNIFITALPTLKGGMSIHNFNNNLPARSSAYTAEEAIDAAGGFNITAPVFYYGESKLTNETIFVLTHDSVNLMTDKHVWYYIVPNHLLNDAVSDSLFYLPTMQRPANSTAMHLTTRLNAQTLEVEGNPALLVLHYWTNAYSKHWYITSHPDINAWNWEGHITQVDLYIHN